MSEIYIGKTLDACPITISRNVRLEHTQIIAATGRGKSKSVIEPWMTQDFCQGAQVILIDGKGDRDLAEGLMQFADNQDDIVVFDIGDVERSATTNPIEFGSPQQLADRIFSTFEFENTYFETVSYEAALMVLELLKQKDKAPTFRELYLNLTDDAMLSELTSEGAQANATHVKRQALSFLAASFRDRQEKLSGFLSQLRPFAIGELAPLINGPINGRRSFSLSESVRCSQREAKQKAIVILIPALLYQKSAARLGQMFLQEVAWASSCRTTQEFLPVFLDEFSSFVYEGFVQFLNKARSSGIALHLCHQSMGDLEAVSPEFAKAIVTNTNVKCVLGVNEPETAEFFAKLFGTREAQKTTERAQRGFWRETEMSGQMSIRDVEEYRVHPNRFKRFTKGQGVISFMTPIGPIIEEVQFEPVPRR